MDFHEDIVGINFMRFYVEAFVSKLFKC